MSLVDGLRRNSLWVLSGDVGARITQLLFGVVLARILVPEDFGLVITVQILTGALGFLSAHGINDALVRAKTLGPRDVATAFSIQLGASGLIVALLYLIAPYFADFFHDDRLAPLLRLASLSFVLRPLMGIPTAMLQRQMRFKELSLLMLVGFVLSGLVSVAAALLGLGAWSLVIGGLAGGLARTALAIHLSAWVPAVSFDRAAASRIGTYGLKISGNEIIQFIRIQTGNALISRNLGTADVGLYNKANSLAEMPSDLLSGSAQQTLFRALASIRDDNQQCAQLFLRAVMLVAFYTLPLCIGLAWLAKPVVLTLYGPQWVDSVLPLRILSIAGALTVVSNLSRSVIASHDRLGKELVIQLETWAVLVAGVMIGLNWGIVGVAFGILPSFIHNAVRMYGLAASALATGWAALWQALAPVIALNALMMLGLGAMHLLLSRSGLSTVLPAYAAAMIATGGLIYSTVIFVRPPPALRSESEQWRGYLRSAISAVEGWRGRN